MFISASSKTNEFRCAIGGAIEQLHAPCEFQLSAFGQQVPTSIANASGDLFLIRREPEAEAFGPIEHALSQLRASGQSFEWPPESSSVAFVRYSARADLGRGAVPIYLLIEPALFISVRDVVLGSLSQSFRLNVFATAPKRTSIERPEHSTLLTADRPLITTVDVAVSVDGTQRHVGDPNLEAAIAEAAAATTPVKRKRWLSFRSD
ncbi:MAG TPA: hypothetical protein VLA00_05580 [Xanthobacteraceae bacterium]|nr:hypothetical protein [Xanthobacteraceae bacterium]